MEMVQKREEEIRLEARRILDGFAKSLEGVELKEKKLKQGVGGFRGEVGAVEGDSEFRKRIFENAPKKEGDFVLAEKKKW